MADDHTETPVEGRPSKRPTLFPLDALPPEMQRPLAAFNGAPPPAPEWFDKALAHKPERQMVDSLGSKLELLTWGERGAPGVLLVHGNSAHADWWSFLAPYLARGRRVASMSLPGMGGSDWRDRYAVADFPADAEACARAAGLYDGPEKPIFVGHSFGGAQLYHAAVRRPDLMRAAILIDVGYGPRGDWRPPNQLGRPYPTFEDAIARFRPMPPQPVSELYVIDFIARHSVREAKGPGGESVGWSWKFDPDYWQKIDREGYLTYERIPSVPTVHVYGELSAIIKVYGHQLPKEIPIIPIAEAHHHVMMDQPLALLAALETLLAAWPA